MLAFLNLASVLVLLVIAYQIGALVARQSALNQYLVTILKPKEYSFLAELAGEPSRMRSILDQIGAIAAQSDGRLEHIDDQLRYFRNYVWEELDRRYIEDIRHPPESREWKMRFAPAEDPRRYGLWMRECDMSEGFHRDVVSPRSQGKAQPQSAEDESSA